MEQLTQERDQLRSRLEQTRTEANDLNSENLSDARNIAELEANLQRLEIEYIALKQKSEREARHLGVMTQRLAAQISRNIELRLSRNRSVEAEKEDQERQSILSEQLDERARIDQALAAAEARVNELNQTLVEIKSYNHAILIAHRGE